MKIYLIRHGEVFERGSPKRYLGVTDIPLTEEGRHTAERTAALLAGRCGSGGGESVKRILVTSPLARCRETARILKEAVRFDEIYEDAMFAEIDLGDWEMKEISEIRKAFPDEYAGRGKDIENYRTPGGETFREAAERFRAALERWTERAGAEGAGELFIVTHRGVMLSGIGLMSGVPIGEMLRAELPYGGVIENAPDAGGWKQITEVEA